MAYFLLLRVNNKLQKKSWLSPNNPLLYLISNEQTHKGQIMVGEITIGLVSLAVLALPCIMCILTIAEIIADARARKERKNS